jgi:hypothetical protein
VLIVIGLLSLDYDPCSHRGTVVLAEGEEMSCGGMDPVPWLVAGGVVAAVSAGLYCAARRWDALRS